MSWSGGSYTKGNAATGGWAGDASLGIGIEAGRHDTQDNDFATGINNCLAKDGQNAMTANINLGGYVPTNVGAGTAAAPAYCAGNDSNTGMFSPTADSIGFATNGSERVRIDNSGNVGVGTTAPGFTLDVQSTGPIVNIGRFIAATNAGGLNFRKSRGATVGTNTIVQSGDNLGGVYFQGANGTGYDDGASIIAQVDGTPGASNDMPGRLCFYTTADGSSTATERMRINSSGNVTIAATPVTNVRFSLNGQSTSSSDYAIVIRDSAPTNLFYIHNDGQINTGVSTLSPYNNTTATTANVVVNPSGYLQRSTSSLKYKTDIQNSEHGLEAVLQLRPVTYKGKTDGDKIFGGLIAEEVHQVGLTEFVQYAEDGSPDALAYGNMVSLAFKAIQELNAKVEALEARVAVLEG